ncbi:hypothetical protein BX600DRAFT_518110 [Xylariales sp. PMI_506]|nr:hypothetical protein BX600DRAFT_518110 [Xylariales sp. PMI_506]
MEAEHRVPRETATPAQHNEPFTFEPAAAQKRSASTSNSPTSGFGPESLGSAVPRVMDLPRVVVLDTSQEHPQVDGAPRLTIPTSPSTSEHYNCGKRKDYKLLHSDLGEVHSDSEVSQNLHSKSRRRFKDDWDKFYRRPDHTHTDETKTETSDKSLENHTNASWVTTCSGSSNPWMLLHEPSTGDDESQGLPEIFPPVGKDDIEKATCILESDAELMSPADRNIHHTPGAVSVAVSVSAPPTMTYQYHSCSQGVKTSQTRPEPIEITDRGDQAYANLEALGRAPPSPTTNRDTDDEEISLEDRIFASAKPAYQSKSKFIPNGQMSALVNEETIRHELVRCLSKTLPTKTIEEYTRKVCRKPDRSEDDNGEGEKSSKIITYRKVFIILVIIEMQECIGKFLDEGVSDADLPLAPVERRNGSNLLTLRRKSAPGEPLGCFNGWSQSKIHSFSDRQWMTLAPFFTKGERKNVCHYPLDDEVSLPFTLESPKQSLPPKTEIFRGGFSRVYKVNIHPDHHNFNETKTPSLEFALKKLDTSNKEDFDREVEVLMKFSGETHQHLVSLLATFCYLGEYYLIFHWAEADLYRLWTEIKVRPTKDKESMLWMLEQCEGIADGLCHIHRYESFAAMRRVDSDPRKKNKSEKRSKYSKESTGGGARGVLYGRHGDIKPENVLWFCNNTSDETDRGRLMITDFGTAEFHSRRSRSNQPWSQIAHSPTYRPPESAVPGEISRSYDIWTLGCLYLEFITWQLGGGELIKDFERQRLAANALSPEMEEDTFFEILLCEETTKPVMRVKKSVIEFIEKLHAHPDCTEFLHEFLNLIQHDMLIVESCNPQERVRISCVDVHCKLETMHHKALHNPEYITAVGPWTPNSHGQIMYHEAVELDLPSEQVALIRKNSKNRHVGPIAKIQKPSIQETDE